MLEDKLKYYLIVNTWRAMCSVRFKPQRSQCFPKINARSELASEGIAFKEHDGFEWFK